MGRMNIRYYRAQRELYESVDFMTGEQKETFLKLCDAIVRVGNGITADILEAFKKLPHQSEDRCVTDMINLHNNLTDFNESFGEIPPIGGNRGF